LDGGKLPTKPSWPHTLLSIVKDFIFVLTTAYQPSREIWSSMILHDLAANQGGLG
jgi:hypothetical protein